MHWETSFNWVTVSHVISIIVAVLPPKSTLYEGAVFLLVYFSLC